MVHLGKASTSCKDRFGLSTSASELGEDKLIAGYRSFPKSSKSIVFTFWKKEIA